MNASADSTAADDRALLVEFERLWVAAADLWDVHEDSAAFGGYVSADFLAIYKVLAGLRGQLTTVLEWGSGLGVVTIMASRMGFEAYGIESEEIWLICRKLWLKSMRRRLNCSRQFRAGRV